MSSIYDIDFGLAASRLSPPVKRKPFYLAWMKTLFSPLQWLRTRIFNDYANSSNAPQFNSGSAYNFGDIVRFEKAIFQNISPSGSAAGIDTSNAQHWYLIQENYIGVRERIVYNSQTIVLNAILNKAFNTTGIWVDNTDNDIEYVYFYNEEEKLSPVYYYLITEDSSEDNRERVLFMYKEKEYSPSHDFIVRVPAALDAGNNRQLISAEVEKYKIAGVSFDIQFSE